MCSREIFFTWLSNSNQKELFQSIMYNQTCPIILMQPSKDHVLLKSNALLTDIALYKYTKQTYLLRMLFIPKIYASSVFVTKLVKNCFYTL